jgi:Kef-type K+ transport system membrane component KefB
MAVRGSFYKATIATVVGYSAAIAAACLLFMLIRQHGEQLAPPTFALDRVASSQSVRGGAFWQLLFALAAILAAAHVLGRLLSFLRQPLVVGEVAAGVLLGPSFLGGASTTIMPPQIAPDLGVIAQLGVVFYMFLVGVRLNPAMLGNHKQATVLISHSSIVLPFVLGSLLALILYPRFSYSDVGFTNFALFIGVAMSITAFPVLARILDDFGLSRTPLGAVALGCAAVDDVTAWCLLAFVVGVVQANVSSGLYVIVGTVTFVGFMLMVRRPFLALLRRHWSKDEPPRGVVTLVFVALLLSATAAEWIGIHAAFGAFLIGALVPHDSVAAETLRRHLERFVGIVLLPAFFAYTGLRTRIDLLDGSDWLICGVVVAVAITGKFGGALVAGRLSGLNWRTSAALGALMNTRGLMELIVLNIGLDLGVISPVVFSIMVIMALATTALAAPVLLLLGVNDERTNGVSVLNVNAVIHETASHRLPTVGATGAAPANSSEA